MNQRELYNALSASDDEDILRRFPTRYEDLKPSVIPLDPQDGLRIVAKGRVFNLHNIPTRGASLIRFKFETMTGNTLSCVLYQQPFYLSKLSSKKELLIVAYYSKNRKSYMVQSILDLDSYYVLTGLKPVYSLPKSVSPSYFANYIKSLLSYPRQASYMLSRVPKKYVEKYRLINEFDAYRCVHLPRSKKDLEEGLRVFKYEEALSYCIRALSLKSKANQKKKENVIAIDHNKINQFVAALSYKLTKDQNVAIREIVTDMEKDTVMYRLLQGDVGTGKTIVCFAVLYANWLRKKRGVLMAPTFELAKQHFHNALKVFQPYPIKIAFLSGNMKAKEKREILEGLSQGTIDILISTNAAVSSPITFASLGLSIIDEQQRFGVNQREMLLNKGESNDLLMMSATPIPRTLSQIINADLEVSTLNQYPQGIRDVTTKLVTHQDPLIDRSIKRALEIKRQVFIVVPKIEENTTSSSSAESVYKDISDRYGKENVQLLHGRIKKEEQDNIIERFVSGEKLILVSTTVIEVGIDVSRAALLIVYDANYFGLSSLHQLRGRVGRSGEAALAILVYDGMDKEAKEKLQFLVENRDGLKISQFDLTQRGAGSYGGSSQSGKSELSICNFVEDLNIFQCAKEDAKEILASSNQEDNSKYLASLSLNDEVHLA